MLCYIRLWSLLMLVSNTPFDVCFLRFVCCRTKAHGAQDFGRLLRITGAQSSQSTHESLPVE